MIQTPLDSSSEILALAENLACVPCEVQAGQSARPELTRLEREVLRYLTANCGRAVSRAEMLSRVWGLNPARTVTRTVDMHIAKLRHKLEHEPDNPGKVLTVRGQGYMLVKQT